MNHLPRARERALTLLEVMVAVAILAMVSVLTYGAFDGLSRGKKGLGRVNDRYHQGRAALSRISAELSSAFLSLHQPLTEPQIRRRTIFASSSGSPADRLDFTSFSHRRLERNAHESDQNELSYFGSPDPAVSGKVDLARRESPLIDIEPKKGGEVNVLAEDIDLFDLRFLDPVTGLWTETWDTSQATGQPNRLPLEVKIVLVLKGGPDGKPITFTTKVSMPMQQPVSFAVPK
ncbi:MAG TPA: type II secretion system protein GspJ [Polyangiaceae bacterium]|nr:type II secretion system protein GspJ [Polyangiaceae bacterium]